MTFRGLPKDYFDFFRELADNNNREWFEDNKPRFRESVQDPLLAFVETMAPHLKKISPYFVADPRRTGGSVFRIYRDVRFSKDKSPYKIHGAIQFRHARGKDAHAPGFYVHVAHNEVFYGGGMWMPPSPALRAIRERIRDHGADWQKLSANKAFKTRFGDIKGDKLTRPPRGFDKDDPMIEVIKQKSFFAMAQSNPVDTRQPDFVKDVATAFKEAKPLMKFLCDATGVPI